MVQPKFEVGQRIKHTNHPDADAGLIIGFSFTPKTGYVYTISLNDFDATTRQLIPAVMHIAEEDAVAVNPVSQPVQPEAQQPAQPQEPVQPANDTQVEEAGEEVQVGTEEVEGE